MRCKTSEIKIDQFARRKDEGITIPKLKSVMAGHCAVRRISLVIWGFYWIELLTLNLFQETGIVPVSFSSGFGGFHASSIASLKAGVSLTLQGSYGSVSSNSVADSFGNLS